MYRLYRIIDGLCSGFCLIVNGLCVHYMRCVDYAWILYGVLSCASYAIM